MVTTELTPCVDGYYAQICRTLVVGEPTPEQKGAHALWREAMEAGIATVRDGVTAADIAKAENDVFRKYGMGKYTTSEFTRVRGHGMGLFADTKPHILEDVTTRIDAGMALIVHPNTYHPVVGYMVLGDGVAVTKDGCEVLTGTAARTVQRPGVRKRIHAPRIDGMERRGTAGRHAGGAARAAPRRDGEGRHGRVRHLHQQHAAERGRLCHRLHAVLVRRLDAGAAGPARRCSPPRCRSACRSGSGPPIR